MFYLHIGFCATFVSGALGGQKGVRSTVTGVTDGCAPSCSRWESNLGLLKEQPLLLTTEPSFSPPVFYWI